MAKAIYPGSFDPITLGHLDIIHRIEQLFTEFTVVVANSHRKQYLFSLEERVQMIRDSTKDSPQLKIDKCDGLIVDYAVANGAAVIVRGLRAISDFEYEMAMAGINKKLKNSIETMIVFTQPEYSFVASRMVKEVAQHGGDLSGMVPANVAAAMAKRVAKI